MRCKGEHMTSSCPARLVACLALVLAGAASAAPPAASVNDLSLEVNALYMLYQFDFTARQLKALQKMVAATAAPPEVRPMARASEEYRRTLVQLRDALVDGTDDDRIATLQEKLDALHEKEPAEIDDSVELTDEARRRAPEVLKLLSARQVGLFVAGYGEAFPDPLERLLEALEAVRGLAPQEWKVLRESLAHEVGQLVAGLDVEKGSQVGDRVIQLLIQVRALKEDEFAKNRADLEEQARDIVGNLGPLDVMRHVLEQALAELLANPRLGMVITARLKQLER